MECIGENKGLNNYEDILKKICNVSDLHYLRGREWEGCLGVACVLSFMKGVPANLQDIGRHLNMSPYNQNLINAFNRLRDNGVFSRQYGVKEDNFLKGEGKISSKYVTPQHMSELIWCQIAGIAGGLTGIKEKNYR